MASDLLSIGTSGLMAFQQSLNTISHNINIYCAGGEGNICHISLIKWVFMLDT